MTGSVWIDLHAHPGRCFLAGLGDSEALVATLGAEQISAALAEAHAAGMAAVTLATVSDLLVLAPDPDKGLRATREFRPGEAVADHGRQLAEIGRVLAEAGVDVAVSAAELERAHAAGRTATLISCEGADFLDGNLEWLAQARALGASSLTLVHYRVNDIGDVQSEESVHGGLTSFGRAVVAECNRLGLIVDCAHASFATTIGVLEASSDPVMVSHSHLQGIGRHHPRLLSEDHAKAVAAAGGLIGAWPSGVTSTSLGDFADEIIRLVDLVGVEHVAIGTDLDGNYRPVLTSYAEFAVLEGLLADRRLSPGEIDSVLGINALGLLRRVAG